MGMGIGAAMTGLRPIVEGMNMGFLLLAFNQVCAVTGLRLSRGVGWRSKWENRDSCGTMAVVRWC